MGSLRPQIVLFGDSITQYSFLIEQTPGWTAKIVQRYDRKADVVLRGYGGYNTILAKFLLVKVFPIPSPNPPLLVTVLLGANDAADPNAGHALVHVPLEKYTENLRDIVAHLKKQLVTYILLITPPPVDEKGLLKYQPIFFGVDSGVLTRTNDVTKLYAEECLKVAKETNVLSMDLWSILQDVPDWREKYLSDGIHLSAQGCARFFDELVKVLDDPGLVPTLNADQMPWDYPHCEEFGEDPTACLEKWCKSHST